MRVLGIELTMATIAVVPILIGLAVDYAIQLQTRIQEEGPPLEDGVAARRGARRADDRRSPRRATAAGFLVLLLSPVPMVRGFGAAARRRASRSRSSAR